MAAIAWSLTAQDDLLDIGIYIARDSPVYAVRMIDRLVEAVEQLGLFPLSGRVVPEFERADLRELIVSSYRIVYLVQADNVTILRVVHGARDILRIAEMNPWDLIQ